MSEAESPNIVTPKEEKPREIHGGRNLIILGISAIVISLTTTAISLAIYRGTGDIYLDRSRPGYISEDEKRSNSEEKQETFSSEGEVSTETIDEYLEEFDSVKGRIDSLSDSFGSDQLSDDALGIYPHTDETETTPE